MNDKLIEAILNLHLAAGVPPSKSTPTEQIKDLIDALRMQRPDVEALGSEAARQKALLEILTSGKADGDEVRGALIMTMLDNERKRLSRLEGAKPSEYTMQWTMAARIAVAVAPDNEQNRVGVFNAVINRFLNSGVTGIKPPGHTKRGELFKQAKLYNIEDPAGTEALVAAYRDENHVLWNK